MLDQDIGQRLLKAEKKIALLIDSVENLTKLTTSQKSELGAITEVQYRLIALLGGDSYSD